MKLPVLIGILLAVGMLAAIVLTSFGNNRFRCEVCMTYQGRQSCRIGAARTRESAERTATDLACAQISGGSFDSQRCANTPPDSVKWLEGH